MESVFEAFISNPALYSAGHLVGETLHFPTNTEEVQSLLKRIGVDGVRCQEYFIISFDSDILGLYDYLGEYENIDELNHPPHQNGTRWRRLWTAASIVALCRT